MKIDVLCNDGSPLGVTLLDLWGEGQRGIGVGGSEYALLTMCEAWQNSGHTVRLYNNPLGAFKVFEQLPIDAFRPKDKTRDVLITFRSPNEKSIVADGLKVWWSCDQYTVNDYAVFAQYMDKIVTISSFHSTYFSLTYGINNSIPIDIPVRVQDFERAEVIKTPYRLIFTSVPDRGLHLLRDAWNRIKKEIPETSLMITADYRLWGLHEPRNERYRQQWIGQEDVVFIGAIPRRRLILEQLTADIYAYPNIYEELFCVSCAEAQACGAYPITSGVGALQTTNMGTIIEGNPQDGRSGFLKKFSNEIIDSLSSREALALRQKAVKKKAIERFRPENILRQWDEKVFEEG
jgi:glycosyltransferase involved in cell wall biosynthesis